MERLSRSFYTHAFKEEAVSLVLNGGLSVAEVSCQLSLAAIQISHLESV